MINKDSETCNNWMNIFYKKLILGDVFHLTFVTPNTAKTIYHLHLLDEFASQRKTVKLKKMFGQILKRFIRLEYPQNLIPEAIRKATSILIENLIA